MSDSNPLPSPSLAEQQTIDNLSLTSPKETVAEDSFDSNDRPDVQPYFASSTNRFQRPRKATRKSTKQDLPPSPSTAAIGATATTARKSSTSSRTGNEDDNSTASQPLVLLQNYSEYDSIMTSEPLSSSHAGRVNGDSMHRKARPRSDIVTLPAGISVDQLTKDFATVKVKNGKLEKSIKILEAKSERDEEEIKQLKDQLKWAKRMESAMASDLEKARADLEGMQGPYKNLVLENGKLDRLNTNLMRQISQVKLSKRDCEMLNATQANQMQELREERSKKTKTIEQLNEKWTKLAKDRVAAAQETQKLANSENTEELQNNISALATDLEAARIQIQELQAELEATRIRMVHFEQQQISLEDECFQYDGAETTSPSFGSPGLSPRRPERRMAESQLLQEARLSDTPALTEDVSTSSTASLASPPAVASPHPIDWAGPGDSPNTSLRVKSRSDPPKRSATWQHENVYQWPSESERRPYAIVGPRPRDLRDLTEEVEVDAVSTNDSGTQTSELREDAPPKTTSDAGTQASAPPVAAASVATPVAARAGRPLWHYVALGTSVLLFLVGHAVLVERRIWGGANELSRRVVVGMRDGWWASPWVEMVGYALDQALAVDRTGFC
jgi:hypothetical protein